MQPEICQQVNQAYLAHWGEPSGSITFDNPTYLPTPRLYVFVWEAADSDDITLFATVGMCCAAMPAAQHRAEINFPVRGQLSNQEISLACRFLANLTAYPFDNNTHLDWWHKIMSTGPIPHFTGCSSVLLHPKFASSGLDTIQTNEALVKVLNAVPLLPNEYAIRPVSALIEYFEEHDIDLFSPRI
ncbi:MAG TPA: suppressor of fused domain protein [Steroidobacteraceae bacterium]|nr:suppressor of fused domain protein [Steroidobacteraceae bacterium]